MTEVPVEYKNGGRYLIINPDQSWIAYPHSAWNAVRYQPDFNSMVQRFKSLRGKLRFSEIRLSALSPRKNLQDLVPAITQLKGNYSYDVTKDSIKIYVHGYQEGKELDKLLLAEYRVRNISPTLQSYVMYTSYPVDGIFNGVLDFPPVLTEDIAQLLQDMRDSNGIMSTFSQQTSRNSSRASSRAQSRTPSRSPPRSPRYDDSDNDSRGSNYKADFRRRTRY